MTTQRSKAGVRPARHTDGATNDVLDNVTDSAADDITDGGDLGTVGDSGCREVDSSSDANRTPSREIDDWTHRWRARTGTALAVVFPDRRLILFAPDVPRPAPARLLDALEAHLRGDDDPSGVCVDRPLLGCLDGGGERAVSDAG